MRTLGLILTAAMVFGTALGCSDDDTGATPDSKVVQKDGAVPDMGVDTMLPDTAPTPDMMVPDQMLPDTGPAPTTSALQTVVNKLYLPKSLTDYAADLDGSGKKKNRLGAIMGALSIAGSALNPQQELDSQLTSGAIILLFDLLGKSITKDLNAVLKFYLGADLDSTPSDNFSGTEELGIHQQSPTDLKLPAQVGASVSGELKAGPGKILVPVPIGATPTTLSLVKAQVAGTLSSTGIASGQINGAIPMTDVNNKLLPAVATLLDAACKSTKNVVICGFDTDQDGTITATDLKNNGVVGLLIFADVDSDGDGKDDAMSVGMGFSAVTCKIKKAP